MAMAMAPSVGYSWEKNYESLSEAKTELLDRMRVLKKEEEGLKKAQETRDSLPDAPGKDLKQTMDAIDTAAVDDLLHETEIKTELECLEKALLSPEIWTKQDAEGVNLTGFCAQQDVSELASDFESISLEEVDAAKAQQLADTSKELEIKLKFEKQLVSIGQQIKLIFAIASSSGTPKEKESLIKSEIIAPIGATDPTKYSSALNRQLLKLVEMLCPTVLPKRGMTSFLYKKTPEEKKAEYFCNLARILYELLDNVGRPRLASKSRRVVRPLGREEGAAPLLPFELIEPFLLEAKKETQKEGNREEVEELVSMMKFIAEQEEKEKREDQDKWKELQKRLEDLRKGRKGGARKRKTRRRRVSNKKKTRKGNKKRLVKTRKGRKAKKGRKTRKH